MCRINCTHLYRYMYTLYDCLNWTWLVIKMYICVSGSVEYVHNIAPQDANNIHRPRVCLDLEGFRPAKTLCHVVRGFFFVVENEDHWNI